MKWVGFGADGIRGYANVWPFLPSLTVRIGQALGQFVIARSEHPVVVIGRDTRPSGSILTTCLSAGLTGQGVDVLNLGIITTPGVAFITRRQTADLGIIVSASHSPHEMNGIKIIDSNGLRLQREQEVDMEVLINKALNSPPMEYPDYVGHETDGEQLHTAYIHEHINGQPNNLLAGLNLVLDCADGAASKIAPTVLSTLGAQVAVTHCETEGSHINMECGSEHARVNPDCLASCIRENHAMYGFAYDGDGDRLVVVDGDENVFDGYDLMYILASYFHAQGVLRQNTVVTTHQANRGLEFALQKLGIRTIYTNNGDRHLEAELWGNNYLLAGEPGGNIIINDGIHTASDASYTSVLLGKVLVGDLHISLIDRVQPLRESLENHPQTMCSIRISNGLDGEQQKIIMKEIDRKGVLLGEGSRVKFWPSSTEPGLYRVMVEGCSSAMREEVSKIAQEIYDLIGSLGNPA